MRPFPSPRGPTVLFALLLSLSASTFAAPVFSSSQISSTVERRRIDARQQAPLDGPSTFETVKTSQTPVATITETCQITLTPSADRTSVLQDKSCTYQVVRNGEDPPPDNGGDREADNGQQEPPPEDGGQISQPPPPEATPPPEQQPPPPGQEILTTVGTATEVGNGAGAASSAGVAAPPSPTESAAGAAPPIREGGLTFIPLDPGATPTVTSAPAPVTAVTTLADGSVSTSVTTPTPEQQNSEGGDNTPGRKLEVLPIGLGVFAGISVIALIVVGLVTYERTKYRKAFRQRKMAETGANMGYGGMAEIR